MNCIAHSFGASLRVSRRRRVLAAALASTTGVRLRRNVVIVRELVLLWAGAELIWRQWRNELLLLLLLEGRQDLGRARFDVRAPNHWRTLGSRASVGALPVRSVLAIHHSSVRVWHNIIFVAAG